MKLHPYRKGFTLPELLLSISILVLLVSLILPAVSRVRLQALQSKDAATMRALGSALLLYAQDNQMSLPRSFHSAGAHQQPGWARSIAPYLDTMFDEANTDWNYFFNTYYRSPFDNETNPYLYSYGLNVYFELDPNGDSYPGSPKKWIRLQQVPNPSQTIALARIQPVLFADHFMCHMWTTPQAVKNAIYTDSHDDKANFGFLDGSVRRLAIEKTFDQERKINLWHPEPDLL